MNKTASWSLASSNHARPVRDGRMWLHASKREGPATYPVTGTVTQNGQPVTGAAIRFPAQRRLQKASTGRTDAEGKICALDL